MQDLNRLTSNDKLISCWGGWGVGGSNTPSPRLPLSDWANIFSGSSANQKLSLAPSAQVRLGQNISSAPLTQGLLRVGGPPHSPPPPPLAPPPQPPIKQNSAPPCPQTAKAAKQMCSGFSLCQCTFDTAFSSARICIVLCPPFEVVCLRMGGGHGPTATPWGLAEEFPGASEREEQTRRTGQFWGPKPLDLRPPSPGGSPFCNNGRGFGKRAQLTGPFIIYYGPKAVKILLSIVDPRAPKVTRTPNSEK